MTRVLFVIHSLSSGGAERVLSRLLCSLADGTGVGAYQVALLDPRITYPVPDGVQVHVLGTPGTSLAGKLVAQLRAFVDLVGLVHRERPDAVVSFMPRSNALNLLGKRWSKQWPRVIVSERTVVGRNYRGPERLLVRGLIRWCYGSADKVIAVARGVADELRQLGVPSDRIVVIPNPVLPEELAAQAGRAGPHPAAVGAAPLVVAVGRLSREKGYTVLLRALAMLAPKWPVRLIVFGEGPQAEELATEAESLGIQDRVTWAGFDPNPFPTVARADVFVLPSLWEGFPNALLEAMALGRPVVASDCEWGPRELLVGGSYGLLVPPGDADALAGALERLFADEPMRNAYGERARARAGEYDLPTIAGRYLAVIEGRE